MSTMLAPMEEIALNLASVDDVTEEDTRVVDQILSLVKEAQDERRSFEDVWEDNLNFYAGEQYKSSPLPGLRYCPINLTQNAVLALAAIQVEQRPRVEILPVENNEPDVFFLKPGSLVDPQVGAAGLTPEQFAGIAPLSAEQAATLAQALSAVVDPATGQAMAALPPDALISLNDQTRAEIVQAVHDQLWNRSHLEHSWLENVINKGVIGHQPMLVQFDHRTNKVQQINLHPSNVWIDPLSTGTSDARYLVWREVLDVAQAKRAYPGHGSLIEKSAATSINDSRFAMDDRYVDTIFERDMVVVTHAWLRDQPYPMSVQDALDGKMAEHAMTTRTGEDGTETEVPVEGTYKLPGEDGALTSPENDNWPARTAIRQVTLIGDKVIEDIECPYADIPVVWNVNIPLPHRPYGQGEPERMRPLQQAINRVSSIFFNHTKYLQSPQMVMTREVKNALGDKAKNPYSHPGAMWIVPRNEMAITGGKPITFIDPPQLNPSYVQYFSVLLQTFKELSGHAEVIQGQTPAGVESGRAIETLQSAARNVIGLRAMYTERAMAYASRILLGIMRNMLPAEVAARMVSKYPAGMVTWVLDHLQADDFDVTVEISAAGGSTRSQEQNKYMLLFQQGALDVEALLEKLEIPDAAKIVERLQQRAAEEAAATAAAGAAKPSDDKGGMNNEGTIKGGPELRQPPQTIQ